MDKIKMTDQTKTLYKKTFTPEVWDKLNVVIDGLGYGKTIQDILEEKYEIIVEDPKKTIELNSIRILEQRKKELLDKQKLEKLRKEVLALEGNEEKTKEQKLIIDLKQEIQETKNLLKIYKIENQECIKEIGRLKQLGNELVVFLKGMDKHRETLKFHGIKYRKDFIDRCKF